MKKIITAIALASFLAVPAFADNRSHHRSGPDRSEHGLVQSRRCPFSCSTQGIAKDHCRDWRQGDTCFVEDTRTRTSALRPDHDGIIDSREYATRDSIRALDRMNRENKAYR
jgi:hypothetical protein